MKCVLSTSLILQVPVHWQFLFIMHTVRASKTTRTVVNTKAPLKKYTTTGESTSFAERHKEILHSSQIYLYFDVKFD